MSRLTDHPRGTGPLRGPIPDLAFRVILGLILLVALAMRSAAIDADAPSDVGRDLALSTDGSWYSARALDDTIQRDCDVTAAYDRAPFTGYARVVYSLFGSSLGATNWISVPPSLLAILFTALAARRLAGNGAGLLAAALLAFNYSFLVFNRNAVIYTFLTMIAAAVLWLLVIANRDRRSWAAVAAWALAIGSVIFVKEILVLLLPALLLSWPLPGLLRRRPAATVTLLTLGGAALAATGYALDLHLGLLQKLHDYFGSAGAADVLNRALDLEARSGLFRALPVVAPLALLAGARRRLESTEALLLVTLLVALTVFAPFRYSPLRYTLPLFPAFAVLASSTLVHLFEAVPRDTGAPTFLNRALRAPILLWLGASAGAAVMSDPATGAVLGGAVSLLILTLLWTRLTRRVPSLVRQPHLAVALLAFALCIELSRSAASYAETRYTTREALRDVDAIVSGSACISGLFSHLLTTENEIDRKLVAASRFGGGRLRRTYESRKVTHLTLAGGDGVAEIVARFAADGAALHHVHTFHVRGLRILLFRFDYATAFYETSPYEKGVTALGTDDPDEAARRFEEAAQGHPTAAAPRSALAVTAMRRGQPDAAALRTEEALTLNPWDVRALGVQAELLLRAGHIDAARSCFELLRQLDPADPRVAEVLRQLELPRKPVDLTTPPPAS